MNESWCGQTAENYESHFRKTVDTCIVFARNVEPLAESFDLLANRLYYANVDSWRAQHDAATGAIAVFKDDIAEFKDRTY